MAQDIMVTLQKLANENTAKTFKFNKEEAALTRSWQERMSNTAHQREVKDLIKAGLNPVLSTGGSGAPSYGASSASGIADSAVNALGSVESSRTSARAMRYSADKSLQAAQAAAAAQKYAADRNYEAARYSADMSYKGKIDSSLTGSAKGLLRGILGEDFEQVAGKKVQQFIKNPSEVSKSSSIGKVWSSLTDYAIHFFGLKLKNNGIRPTPYTIALFAKSLAFSDLQALRMLQNMQHRPITAFESYKRAFYK